MSSRVIDSILGSGRSMPPVGACSLKGGSSAIVARRVPVNLQVSVGWSVSRAGTSTTDPLTDSDISTLRELTDVLRLIGRPKALDGSQEESGKTCRDCMLRVISGVQAVEVSLILIQKAGRTGNDLHIYPILHCHLVQRRTNELLQLALAVVARC